MRERGRRPAMKIRNSLEVAQVAPPGLPCHPPPRPDLRHQQDEPPLQSAAGLRSGGSGACMLAGAKPGPSRAASARLLRDYRRFAGARLWLALALMLLGALAEGFGLLMIVPLASDRDHRRRVSTLLRFAPWAAALAGRPVASSSPSRCSSAPWRRVQSCCSLRDALLARPSLGI